MLCTCPCCAFFGSACAVLVWHALSAAQQSRLSRGGEGPAHSPQLQCCTATLQAMQEDASVGDPSKQLSAGAEEPAPATDGAVEPPGLGGLSAQPSRSSPRNLSDSAGDDPLPSGRHPAQGSVRSSLGEGSSQGTAQRGSSGFELGPALQTTQLEVSAPRAWEVVERCLLAASNWRAAAASAWCRFWCSMQHRVGLPVRAFSQEASAAQRSAHSKGRLSAPPPPHRAAACRRSRTGRRSGSCAAAGSLLATWCWRACERSVPALLRCLSPTIPSSSAGTRTAGR